MSSWYVRQIWFGVEGPKPELPMLGIIKRSGRCHQTGHFCHVEISVNGFRVWASGAESRTFYMHLVQWKDIAQRIPKDLIPAVGWTKGGNGYAFRHEGRLVYAGRQGTLEPVPRDEFLPEWWEIDFLSPDKERPASLTLIEKGAHLVRTNVMFNHYIALMEDPMHEDRGWGQARRDRPVVTLPVGSFSTETNEFEGLTGAVSMWNGPPPAWCKQVVEIRCDGGWIHVKDEHTKELWRR